MKVTDGINEYFLLMEKRPEFFAESEIFPIENDRKILEKYAEENGVPLGVAYKSPYTTLVVDLIKKPEGGYFTYERILPTADGKGVVCIPRYKGNFVLIRQYRHSMRDFQLCFPRGFGENGITASDNAKKELFEEIGAQTCEVKCIGDVVADSGLSGAKVGIMLCEISDFKPKDGHEGIVSTVVLTENELENKIGEGEINDGFTLSAFQLYKNFPE